jgi:hypothetical protein
MRTKQVTSAVVVIAAGLLLGCEKSETKPTTSTPAATAPSAAAAADTVKDSAAAASDTAAAKGNEAAAKADEAAGDAQTKATELLTQVTTYVKDNKMDLAEKALAQLDKLKPSLPEAFQGKIDSAHKMFDAAKQGQALKYAGGGLLGK